MSAQAKPILKWAGGKTQMLGDLLPKVPTSFGRYIEPFFGGGAMFFALQPENAVIADSNPELINMYREVADHVEDVIQCLKQYENTSEMFYAVRSQEWTTLPKAEAAARTIFLNRTCFNGLYRVNKQGQFNVPYGKYKNPKICDEDGLRAASVALQKVDILCGDYLLVLEHYAQPGDFIFLDPPYLPVSEYADFKRYTKEQYNILDLRQRRSASQAKRSFDKKEIAKRGENYDKKADNFLDYGDMNMRYLRISGVLQRKGRGLIIVPTKRILAEKLAKSTASLQSIMEQYKLLCTGAPLPTDNMDVAKSLLDDLVRQMKERHILFDISDLPLNTPTEVNIARQRLENILAQTDEIQYASDQCNQWEEIRDYMTLLIKGGGKMWIRYRYSKA